MARHGRSFPSRRNKPFLFPTAGVFTYVGTGGLTFGGTASLKRTIVASAPSGGIVFAGTGILKRTIVATAPTGGITFGGTGNPVKRTYAAPAPTGGIVFAGSGSFKRTKIIVPSGGIIFAGSGNVTALFLTPTVTTVEGITRNQLFKRFLRETGLGVYGTVTGVGGGATTTFDDTTRLRSTQFNAADWRGAWARISKNADSVGTSPENEVQAVTLYDPTTNGRITAGTFGSIGVSDEYELWRFPNPLTVEDDLDVVLQEDIFLPFWTMLSECPDFDMEQNNTTDWTLSTGSTVSKVTSGNPYMQGKRYLAITTSGTVGLVKTANTIKVEPNTKYHLSAVGYASAASNTLTLSAYDETNGATITSTTWARQYQGRLFCEFTTPATCYSITLRMGHSATSAISYWDSVCFYQVNSPDIALPWWVKNKNQIKAIFNYKAPQLGTNVYDPVLVGNLATDQYDIRDNAFGSGQLRLVGRTAGFSQPLFIFGVRNEVAYANDTVDTKRVDANLLIAALAAKVFKRLKVFPNANAMQTTWIDIQYKDWVELYKQLSRQQAERIEEVLRAIPVSGMYQSDIGNRYN